jgi:hypothetical protein
MKQNKTLYNRFQGLVAVLGTVRVHLPQLHDVLPSTYPRQTIESLNSVSDNTITCCASRHRTAKPARNATLGKRSPITFYVNRNPTHM